MNAPHLGQQFVMQHERAWAGPCKACGHRTPTHLAPALPGAKRRHRVACPTHAPVAGLERYATRATVTELRDGGLSYSDLALVGDVTSPCPGTEALPRVAKGGMTTEYWFRCLADGTITLAEEAR